MYKHHEESLERLIEYFSDKEEVIAVILAARSRRGVSAPTRTSTR